MNDDAAHYDDLLVIGLECTNLDNFFFDTIMCTIMYDNVYDNVYATSRSSIVGTDWPRRREGAGKKKQFPNLSRAMLVHDY